MYALLMALIVSQATSAPMEYPYAATIYSMDFEQAADQNYDGWPDDWTRRRGLGFPSFLPIEIVSDPDCVGSRCLHIGLDGGGASIHSPPIPIDARHGYVLEVSLKTRGLRHSAAQLSLSLLDANKQKKETHSSDPLVHVPDWTRIRIGPLTPGRDDIRWGVIGLHLLPSDRSDLSGSAWFDDVRLARLPRMTLGTTEDLACFQDPSEVKIWCRVSGMEPPGPPAQLELLDVAGDLVGTASLPFETTEVAVQVAPARVQAERDIESSADIARDLQLSWRPPVTAPGFYQVRATVRGEDGTTLQQTTAFIVRDAYPSAARGEFGWSLPRSAHELPDQRLLALLEQAGVRWAKLPVWHDPDDTEQAERIARRVDQLAARGIEVVGVFDEIPARLRGQLGGSAELNVADVFFSGSQHWHHSVDPTLARLSGTVRWWQLGADGETRATDYPDIAERIHEVRSHFRAVSQRAGVGVAWPWLHEFPSVVPAGDFLARSEAPTFTPAELLRHAAAKPLGENRSWISLTPLPAGLYDPSTRARDLVLRLVAAKTTGSPAIFATLPLDDVHGLVRADGTPGELFLPWCMTTSLLGGTEYLGSLQLPFGSSNHVFAREDSAVMVLWNDQHTTEPLHLGNHLTPVDVWGRSIPPTAHIVPTENGYPVAASTLPVIVTGIDLQLAKWQLACALDPDELSGAFSEQQSLRVRFVNPFPVGVAGTVTLVPPEQWTVARETLNFEVAAGESLDREFLVRLTEDARSGVEQVRIEFRVEAEQVYQFPVYRRVRVGRGDVKVSLTTWLDDAGQLIVEQEVLNDTGGPLDFNCILFASGRRRVRQPMLNVDSGRSAQLFLLPDGEELLGTTLWLRMEEMGGNRVLNMDVVAER